MKVIQFKIFIRAIQKKEKVGGGEDGGREGEGGEEEKGKGRRRVIIN